LWFAAAWEGTGWIETHFVIDMCSPDSFFFSPHSMGEKPKRISFRLLAVLPRKMQSQVARVDADALGYWHGKHRMAVCEEDEKSHQHQDKLRRYLRGT